MDIRILHILNLKKKNDFYILLENVITLFYVEFSSVLFWISKINLELNIGGALSHKKLQLSSLFILCT